MKHLILLLLSLTSTFVHSHPGHDHALWFADAYHIALTLLILSALIIGYVLSRNHSGTKQNKKEHK